MTRIYVAFTDTLAVISGQGTHWDLEEREFDDRPLCLAVDPVNPDHLYCGGFEQGLWTSENAGRTWILPTTPASPGMVSALAVSDRKTTGKNGAVWIGTGPAAIKYSEDGGKTWIECASLHNFLPPPHNEAASASLYPHHVRWILLDPLNTERIFVALDQGPILRSLDKGQSWRVLPAVGQGKGHTLRTHQQKPGKIYMAAGGERARLRPRLRLGIPPFQARIVVEQGGYAESEDSGTNWRLCDEGLHGQHYLWGLALDPADPEIMVASAAVGPLQAHEVELCESYILRREHGHNWQRITTGLPAARGTLISVLGTTDAEPGVFYAANNRGIFRSADTGLSWQPLTIDWPARYQRQHVQSMIVI